jgi:phage shock protein A
MPGIFSRFRDLIKAKTHAALDKLEDPEELLEYKYQQLQDERKRIERAVRDSIADRNLIQSELEEMQKKEKKLHEKAKLYRMKALSLEQQAAQAPDAKAQQAIAKYNGEALRLLQQKLRLDERSREMQTNLETATLRVNAIKEKRIDLDAKLDDLRLKKEELKSDWRMAKAEERISGALAGLEGDFSDVDLTMQRIEEKVKRKKALAAASAELAADRRADDVIDIAGEHELRAEAALQEIDRELLGAGHPQSLAAGPTAPAYFLVAISGGGTWAFPMNTRAELLQALNRSDDELVQLAKGNQLSREKFEELYRKIFQLIRERGQLVGRDVPLGVVSGSQGYPTPEVTLPPEDLEYEEALKLLQGKGLIPS